MSAVKKFVGVCAIAVLVAAAALVPAFGAQAATQVVTPPTHDVQFSTDGATWSDSYTGALFGDAVLIPGGSADRTFYVRNGSPDPALLRVTLFDVSTTDTALASALSLTTSTPGQAGTAVPVTSARPCATLTSGQTLASGGDIRLATLAALADLNGVDGQGRTVSFKLAVTLSSTDSAAPAPDSCPADLDSGVVVGVPDAGSTTGGATGATTATVYRLGASGWTGAAAPATRSGPAGSNPAPISTPDGSTPFVRALVANTERLYQENIVALWLAMAVLGALILLFVRRRRADPTDSASQPAQQIGTGR